ncbi:MAG TPA: hypothetical protein PKM39_08845, partial [Pseudothauera hydrothermalis]|nr:hypothetical protein [Pseudothauera hydrothermalis]
MRSLRLGLLLLLLSLATAAHAVRFKVTTIMDNTSGSLREAIVMANLTPGRDTIAFDIDAATWGPGPWTLNLNSALPEITGQVSILGYTQPGSWPGIPGQVMIEIDHGSIPFTDDDFGAALVFVRGSERSVVSGLGFFGINARSSAAVLVLAVYATLYVLALGNKNALQAEAAGALAQADTAQRFDRQINEIEKTMR